VHDRGGRGQRWISRSQDYCEKTEAVAGREERSPLHASDATENSIGRGSGGRASAWTFVRQLSCRVVGGQPATEATAASSSADGRLLVQRRPSCFSDSTPGSHSPFSLFRSVSNRRSDRVGVLAPGRA